MQELVQMKCVACNKDAPKVTEEEIAEILPQVPEWRILTRESIDQLERIFKFKNFSKALLFTNQVGALAEAEGHHPALLTEWGQVTARWWTHKIKGLHRNDFIMAAKTDQYYKKFSDNTSVTS
jgi:4a-hydroxytetrahydrobiopterin dehydratase